MGLKIDEEKIATIFLGIIFFCLFTFLSQFTFFVYLMVACFALCITTFIRNFIRHPNVFDALTICQYLVMIADIYFNYKLDIFMPLTNNLSAINLLAFSFFSVAIALFGDKLFENEYYASATKKNETIAQSLGAINYIIISSPMLYTLFIDKTFYQSMANFIATKLRIHNYFYVLILLDTCVTLSSTFLVKSACMLVPNKQATWMKRQCFALLEEQERREQNYC